jgi:hypothetical protein
MSGKISDDRVTGRANLSNAARFPELTRVIKLPQNRNAEMTIYIEKPYCCPSNI